jgi:hypothetical protein
MVDGRSNIVQNKPAFRERIAKASPRGVLSFHYYDVMAIAGSYLKIPENLTRD